MTPYTGIFYFYNKPSDREYVFYSYYSRALRTQTESVELNQNITDGELRAMIHELIESGNNT